MTDQTWNSSRLGRWWVNRRADSDLAKDREVWRTRDLERNQASKPPTDESCELVAVWVAEVFTPSTLSGLTEGLRRRGWDYSRTGDYDLVDWILRSRKTGAGSWSRLGLVRRGGEGRADLRDDLPPGVDAIKLGVFTLTSSISVVTAACVLSKEAALGYHETLTADYETVLLPLERDRERRLAHLGWRIRYGPGWMLRRGQRIEDPESRRREAARAYLVGHKERAQQWIAERFPGIFAKGLLAGDFPAASMNVLDESEPFVKRGADWQKVAGLGDWYSTWRSEEWPGCVLALPGATPGDVSHLIRLAVKRSDTEEWLRDSSTNWSVSLRADEFFAGLLARWAILTASYAQREALAALRDVTSGKTEHRVVKELKFLRERVSSSALDTELLAREGADLADDMDRLRRHTVEFSREDAIGGEKVNLLDVVAESIRDHARNLSSVNRLILETTMSIADLTVAVSNIRLQRIVTGVSILSFLVAAIALIVAVSGATG